MRSFLSVNSWSCLLAVALLPSCASLSHDPLLGVRSRTREQLGYDVAAPATAQDSAAVAGRVEALLKRPLTAGGAVQIALLNNRRLRATLEEVGISQAELVEAGTPRNLSLASSVRFPSGGGSPDWEFNLAGEFLDALMIPMKRRMAALELVRTERKVSHEILQLAAETRNAWFMVLAAEQQLRKLQDIAGVNESVSDFATRVHDAGNINDLELMELQVGSQQAQADIKRERAEMEAFRAKLSRLLGVSGTQAQWTLAAHELPPLPVGDPSLAVAESAALSQRQDLAAAHAHVTAMEKALVLKRKTRLLPGLKLGVDTERGAGMAPVTGPTLDLELPVFNWGRASVAKMEAELRQVRAEAEALEAEVRNDVAAAHAALRLARDSAQFQKTTLLPQRQRILQETLLHYNAMQKGNIALLMAKDQEQRSERDAIESLRDYWLARGDLEKAAGGKIGAQTSKAQHH